ncbi:MAG: prepilin peptidase [Deltaproteobacteria bacterium]|nr:prepilin peptidase [Deltaproteobacteria bacterium]
MLFLFRFTFALGLVIVIFSDLETLLIPDLISLPGIALGLAASLVIHPHTGVGWMSSLIGAAAGAAVVMLVRTVYWLVFHMEGMGFGDVKLMGMIGAFLGYESLVFVFFAGSLQGLLYAAASWLAGARQPPVPTDGGAPPGAGEAPATFRRMVVPFGPFLGLAALEWLFFSQVFIDLLNDLFML